MNHGERAIRSSVDDLFHHRSPNADTSKLADGSAAAPSDTLETIILRLPWTFTPLSGIATRVVAADPPGAVTRLPIVQYEVDENCVVHENVIEPVPLSVTELTPYDALIVPLTVAEHHAFAADG